MKNAIFIVTDEKYFKYTKACINSIKDNWKTHPEIIVSYKTNKIKEEDFNFLRFNKIKIRIYNNYNFGFPLGPVKNSIIYQKFFLWHDDYFDEYENILHLDSDTLILKPLDKFLDDNRFYIVSNYEQVPHINVFGNKKNLNIYQTLQNNNLNYPEKEYSMVNAGIFTIPKMYRSKVYYHLLEKMGNYFYKWIKYADQSIISLWCQYCDIKPLINYYYNFQTTFSTILSKDLDSIYILHFSGIKPDDEKYLTWNWLDKEFALKSKELFYKYLEMN